MRIICHEPLIERWERDRALARVHDTLLLEESDEVAKALGCFREFARTISREPRDIMV
jgi:hypothetical protein